MLYFDGGLTAECQLTEGQRRNRICQIANIDVECAECDGWLEQ